MTLSEFYLQEIIDAELKLEKEQQNYLDLQVSDRALQEQLLRTQLHSAYRSGPRSTYLSS